MDGRRRSEEGLSLVVFSAWRERRLRLDRNRTVSVGDRRPRRTWNVGGRKESCAEVFVGR